MQQVTASMGAKTRFLNQLAARAATEDAYQARDFRILRPNPHDRVIRNAGGSLMRQPLFSGSLNRSADAYDLWEVATPGSGFCP